ncbi:hypothetical protein GCM10007916_37270 [Psychromonas marina]|uniref:Uncharacterized protein n=1 Tax=Psychromonas marina TaxID=88364 RepID=A0ABQ6E679_9GAMM|nr:protein YgfX [Psychromonas marina]GLS92655.1 hypothetical protein GCM10007916_37270 [Psychromonas marina]
MSSLSALRYKITVNPSYYAGIVVFLLYCLAILLALFVTPLTLISSILYLLLFLIAFIAAKYAVRQVAELLLSESGLVERKLGDKDYAGQISEASFYNRFFIFLILKEMKSGLFDKGEKQFVLIYRDAISVADYRLLARIINSGRN